MWEAAVSRWRLTVTDVVLKVLQSCRDEPSCTSSQLSWFILWKWKLWCRDDHWQSLWIISLTHVTATIRSVSQFNCCNWLAVGLKGRDMCHAITISGGNGLLSPGWLCLCKQWWNVTKYFYSITVPKYTFEVLVPEYFHFPLFYTLSQHYIWEADVLFTPQHLSYNFSY